MVVATVLVLDSDHNVVASSTQNLKKVLSQSW